RCWRPACVWRCWGRPAPDCCCLGDPAGRPYPRPHPAPHPDRGPRQPGPDPAPQQNRAPTADPAREAILGRLRGVSLSIPGGAGAPLPDPTVGAASGGALSARFGEELAALGGVFRLVSAEKLGQTLVEMLAERGAKSVFTWVPEMLPMPGLYERLRREGITVFGPMVSTAGPDRPAGLADRAAAAVGLTGC
ncbi:MAG: hypothetical protein HY784_15165, partial [Chloroflexi bacterium]|nr:hypothetical protein [Chloroflexota bacterium]